MLTTKQRSTAIAALDRYGDRAGALRDFGPGRNDSNRNSGRSLRPRRRKLARRVLAPRWGESTETPSTAGRRSIGCPRGLPGTTPVAAVAPPLLSAVETPAATRRRTVATRTRRRDRCQRHCTLSDSPSATVVSRYSPSSPSWAVAVLPLRGLGDSTTVRAGESIAEELTTALAQLPGNLRYDRRLERATSFGLPTISARSRGGSTSVTCSREA